MMKVFGPPPTSFRDQMFESMAQRIAREGAEIEEHSKYARQQDWRLYIRILLSKESPCLCLWTFSCWLGCC